MSNFDRILAVHKEQCTFYGVPALLDSEVKALHEQGWNLKDIYWVACDVYAGFSINESVSALRLHYEHYGKASKG